jgi:20S proteasome subunit alpha 5
MTLTEGETLALTVLKQVMEERLNKTNVEMASVTSTYGFHVYPADQLQSVIDRL